MQCYAQVRQPSFAHWSPTSQRLQNPYSREAQGWRETERDYQRPTPTNHEQGWQSPAAYFPPTSSRLVVYNILMMTLRLQTRHYPKSTKRAETGKSVVSYLPEAYKKIRPGVPNKQRPWQLCLLTTRQEQRRGIPKLHFSAPTKCRELQVRISWAW